MANWPNSLHFLTNYGMMIFDFSLDLSKAKFEDLKRLTPINVRLIRINFDEFNGEIVQNPYGSAFLVKKFDEADNFVVSLAAMSYYSAPNSQLFKLINIT